MRLKGKVAVITGGGAGIGEASAILFSREGARVVVADNNKKNGEETVKRIIKNGGEAIFVKADVSRLKEVKEIFKVTKKKYGSLHILYNNAGIYLRGKSDRSDGPVAKIEEKVWDKIIEVNLKGTFLCSKYAIPLIIKSGGGAVINTSSSAGVMGKPKSSAYSAAKGGIIALTRSMAVAYASRKVRVNCIVPCAVVTPMLKETSLKTPGFDKKKFFSDKTPLGRFGKPEEIANLALFLASDEASYLVGGLFVADGGITIS